LRVSPITEWDQLAILVLPRRPVHGVGAPQTPQIRT